MWEPALVERSAAAPRHSSSPSLSPGSSILLGLAAIVCALVTVDSGSRPASARASSPTISNGKIAFNSRRTEFGLSSIFVMNSDGSGVVQVTDTGANDFRPLWSPDGTRIVYDEESNSGGNLDVYSMNADGSNQTRLTDDPAADWGGDWSPDGTKIAFTS